MEKLPDSFDVIVCGTGLTETMVAASLSRIDKKVLHIDRNDYYGSNWATFTFDMLVEFLKQHENKETLELQENNDEAFVIPQSNFSIQNVLVKSFISESNNDLRIVESLEDDSSIKTTVSAPSQDSNVTTRATTSEDTATTAVIATSDDISSPEDDGNVFGTNTQNLSPDEPIQSDVSSRSCEQIEEKTEHTAELQQKNHQIDMNPSQKIVKQPAPSIVSQAKIKKGGNDITLEDLKILSRKFSLDLTPKFLFSAGPLVDAIIKANITHYAEFKLVNRILMCQNESIVEVPCNRADVFNSSFLSMIEKRMLMKFLNLCIDLNVESEEVKLFIGKPFDEFLETKRLTGNLRNFIIHSIAMVKPCANTEEALVKTQTFLKSLGKFGKSPFIWPLFGVGELPQAFCRMSAVFGGLYCLRKDIRSINFDSESGLCSHISIDDQEISCKHVVLESSYIPGKLIQAEKSYVSKAILITNKSLAPSNEEHVSFLTIPPIEGKDELVRVIEVGPAASACPSGLFVLYLTCVSKKTSFEDLETYVSQLTHPLDDKSYDGSKPKLLWVAYFNHVEEIDVNDTPKNMFVTSLPDSSLGFAKAVAEAKNIFQSICPDEEFMMAVPNPEDIIWGHEDQVDVNAEADAKSVENESTIREESDSTVEPCTGTEK